MSIVDWPLESVGFPVQSVSSRLSRRYTDPVGLTAVVSDKLAFRDYRMQRTSWQFRKVLLR